MPTMTQTGRYAGLDLRIDTPPEWSVQTHREALTNHLVVVDTETTSLRAYPGSVTEIAWYDLRDGVGGSFIPPHTLDGADPKALEISRYHERIAGRPVDADQTRAFHRMLRSDGQAIIVGSNPNFDLAQLKELFTWARMAPEPWQRRVFDPAAAAYWLYPERELGRPTGLAAACELAGISSDGHHDAFVDVVMTAKLWHALEALRGSK